MHSYLTWQSQPQVYTHYTMFVAEVASNFHQAMLRAHMLETVDDPALQLAVLEEAMANFRRYFFIMPTLARLEREIHERVARGEGLTAELLGDRMADLFAEGYGPDVEVDRARVGITWAEFGHLYEPFYVYQYATGISGAHALARGVLDGDDGAAGRYLEFLSAGDSLYPLDALRARGRRPAIARARRADIRRARIARRPHRGADLDGHRLDGDRARPGAWPWRSGVPRRRGRDRADGPRR